MIYSTFLIISLILFTVNIIQILAVKHTNNIIFLILCTIILNTTLILFWKFYNNLTVSLIVSLLLMINVYILVLELRVNYQKNMKYAIPYFILCIYNFAKIIDSFLYLARQ